MEANQLPPGQSVQPISVPTSTPLADASAPVSSYSGSQKSYPIESLEVHQEGQPLIRPSYAPTSQSIPFSRRRATIVSLVITIVVILITGLASAFFVRRSVERPTSQIDVPTQDASLAGIIDSDLPAELQGLENTLLVSGDIATRGHLRVISGSFTNTIESAVLTGNQTITLPNASGEVCLNANNCNFATIAQLNQIQPVGGVTTLNDLAGGVTIQGALNQITVATADGVITLSTPQALDVNANVQFSNLTLNGLGTGPLRVSNGSLVVGTINLGSADVTGITAVINGGTGANTLTANGVLLGNGQSPITAVTAGGSGLCLVSTVGAPAFQACPGGGGVSSVNSLVGDLTIQGTANQINVASGGTTITLSTPQDIATTSNVLFNGLTVTTNADVNGALAVGSNAGLSPTTNALVVNHDITGDCSFGCSGVSVTAEGTVAATWVWGVISGVNMTNGGTFNAAGLYAKSAVVSGTGGIGSNYGLYVAPQTVGTNDYGIYVEGADTYALWIDSGISRFDGNLEFEGTTDDAFETTLTVANPTSIDKTITLPDETGTVCLRNSALCGFATGSGTGFLQGGNNFGGATAGTLGTINGGDLNLITNNLTRLTVQADGDVAVDTNTLFVDAANNRVGIGTATPGTGGEVVTLEVNGGIGIIDDHPLIFSTNASKFWSLNPQEANNKFVLSSQGTGIVAFNSVGWLRNSTFGPSDFPDAEIHTGGSTVALNAWGTNGLQLRVDPGTYTDDSTAISGTATNAVFNSFAQPTLTATNTGVTTTNAATVYVQNSPAAGTNQTITNAYAFWVDDGVTRLDGNLVVDADTFNVNAADNSVGIRTAATANNLLTFATHATDIEIKGTGDNLFGTEVDGGIEIMLDDNNNSGGNEINIYHDGSYGTPIFTMSELGDITTATQTITFVQGWLRLGVESVTIPDSGNGSPATLTYEPLASYAEFTCNDADTCDVTMNDTTSSQGQTIRMVNVGTNSVDFPNTAGVQQLSANPIALGQYDTLTLIYSSDRWIQYATSNNL